MKIYLCTNPAWPNHTKIGVTNKKLYKKRLNGYLTASPYRDYKFQTVIDYEYATELEQCLIYYFNGISNENEWVNKPHDEVLEVLYKFMKRISEDPERAKQWINDQEEEIEADTYKYVDYSYHKVGLKYLFKFTTIKGIKDLISKRNLSGVDIDQIPLDKYMTSQEIAKHVNLYTKDGSPYAGIINGYGERNKYGLQRIDINEYHNPSPKGHGSVELQEEPPLDIDSLGDYFNNQNYTILSD